MDGKRWLSGVVAAVLAATVALVAWSYGQRAYAYPVEYSRIAVVTSSPYWSLGGSTTIEQWADLRHHVMRTTITGIAGPIDRVVRDGHVYDANPATSRLFAGATLAAWLDWLGKRGCDGVSDGGSRTARLDIGSGYTALVHCARARVPAGTLAANFFAPPDRSAALWTRLRLLLRTIGG